MYNRVYQLLRALSARMIAGNQPVFDRARTHALQVLSLEQFLGIDIELALQRNILASCPSLMSLLARVYYSHICIGVMFIVYTYTYLPRPTFQRIRRTIAADNAIAFVVITLWRCSPPRLLPSEYGYLDILHGGGGTQVGGGSAWTQNKFQLTIAAMPSLHFGTALFLAVCLWRFSPHGLIRAVAPVWPAAMLLTILATANHFVMDAVVGAVIPLLGWRYVQGYVARLGELQEWVLGPVVRRMDLVVDEEGFPGKEVLD